MLIDWLPIGTYYVPIYPNASAMPRYPAQSQYRIYTLGDSALYEVNSLLGDRVTRTTLVWVKRERQEVKIINEYKLFETYPVGMSGIIPIYTHIYKSVIDLDELKVMF